MTAFDFVTAEYVWAWACAFAITEACEMPIYKLTTRVPWWACFVPSAITHPFVWFAFPLLREVGASYLEMAAAAEAFAVLVEAFFLHLWLGVTCKRAFASSLVANASSVGVGLVLRRFHLL